VLRDGNWIRIYPIPFRALPFDQQYQKYSWIQLNLVRKYEDFRPESYRPQHGFEEKIAIHDRVGTDSQWAERKGLVLKNVFTSMHELINLSQGPERRSLAVLKPQEIIDFVIEPEPERRWKPQWEARLAQAQMFAVGSHLPGKPRQVVQKLPYKYSYRFRSEGDLKPRKMMIEDWEIGALYWNCLKRVNGDEVAANNMVRQKYFEEFLNNRDIYLFLGTTLTHHLGSPNPFVIIGVFYPPKVNGLEQRALGI
jgi:hypothetical protein